MIYLLSLDSVFQTYEEMKEDSDCIYKSLLYIFSESERITDQQEHRCPYVPQLL